MMRYTICDLETFPIADAESYVEPISTEPVNAPANYKDPEKIAAYVAKATVEAEEKRIKQQAERIAKCALDPDLCRIVALGWIESDGNEGLYHCSDEHAEATALMLFWLQQQRYSTLVGFN